MLPINSGGFVRGRHPGEPARRTRTGVQIFCKYSKHLDSGFRRNDGKDGFAVFREAVNYSALLKRTIGKKDSGFKLAPPTRAPSMSGLDMRSRTLSGLTLPP